jgi:hypothetical protein
MWSRIINTRHVIARTYVGTHIVKKVICCTVRGGCDHDEDIIILEFPKIRLTLRLDSPDVKFSLAPKHGKKSFSKVC